ncbi:AAA family ATPase [Spirosoma daeguense]
MHDKRGSIWRKWDLHFHTPSSYDYADKSITNQEIIDGLIKNNIEVVSITDHHIIDVKRIKELQALGKGKVTILPGIEFLSDLRGKEPIHFIAIFAEDCNMDYIWAQIENSTEIKHVRGKSKSHNEVYCDLLDTSKLIRELGGIITIHAGNKSNGIENITNSLPHASAQKEDIAIAVDIFELGKEKDIEGYTKHVIPHLQKVIDKTLPLIVCSDNHDIRDYIIKQNLWIKGDPTFYILRQLINQPDRAYIGAKPASLEVVENNPTKYVEKIKIGKKTGSIFDETWFNDTEIHLNPGLVAIIGNKGNGKSALTDILGLCGNTHNHTGFSFLHPKKFLDNKRKKAENFEATLTWRNGKTSTHCLSQDTDVNQEERIKYIPQSYLEKLCVSIEGGDFEEELKAIIFSHIPQYDRLGKNNLQELINHKTQIIRDDIEKIKSDVSIINSKIISLEEKENPAYLSKLEESLKLKQEELEAHQALKPKEEAQPEIAGSNFETTNESIRRLREENSLVTQELRVNNQEISILNGEIEILKQRKQSLDSLKQQLDSQIVENQRILGDAGIDLSTIFSFHLDTSPISNLITEKAVRSKTLEAIVAPDGAYSSRLAAIQKELIELQNQLDLPAKLYQEYLTNLAKWDEVGQAIIGASDVEGSMTNLIANITYVKDQLGNDLKDKYRERKKLVQDIFKKKQEVLVIYQDLYKSVTEFITKHNALMDSYKITFDTLFKEQDLYSRFEGFINFNSKGSFYGLTEGQNKLKDLFEVADFSSEEEAYSFVFKVLDHIKYDNRAGNRSYREIKAQLKSGNSSIDFYNFLCGLDYLAPGYDLKLSNKNVSTLSPGERGALLLIFYLILDNNHIPLIIDQPEENLDNQSVFKILVPFIKMAKLNRQVIIVTHNPNLAVVCDADQIVHVRIDKENKNEVYVMAGGLENAIITSKIVEILEGTYPAFFTRTNTYKYVGRHLAV